MCANIVFDIILITILPPLSIMVLPLPLLSIMVLPLPLPYTLHKAFKAQEPVTGGLNLV